MRHTSLGDQEGTVGVRWEREEYQAAQYRKSSFCAKCHVSLFYLLIP
jgi:hypothetical protein